MLTTRITNVRITRQRILAALAAFAVAIYAGPVSAQSAPAEATAKEAVFSEPIPAFDKAYLENAANIKLGETVWMNQCRHCHGNSAYPGKAPKLNPGSLDPEKIFDRVTNGFRKMPSWRTVFSLEERKGVVAYVKSDSFSP